MSRCINCNNQKGVKYLTVDGYDLLECNNCGLLSTKASNLQIMKYVRSKYNKHYAVNYSKALPKLYLRFKSHLDLIQKFVSGGNFLDVGCGTGYFLKYVLDQTSEYNVFGIEPNTLLRRFASSNIKKPVKNGILSRIPYKNNYFDIITCYDVLEHNISLKKNLHELRRVLKPGGCIFIQAPNYKSYMAYITGKRWDWWCVPDHVLHFSYDFLTKYIEDNGFRILKSYTYEDQEDYLSNIKGIFSKNLISKILFRVLLPIFLIIERAGWIANHGGLTVILAQKK